MRSHQTEVARWVVFFVVVVVVVEGEKGYVPVLVGRGAAAEMVYVHVKHFGLPTMAVLLEMAEEEMGKQSEGILRIPCVEAAHFRHVLKAISNGK
ncbi:hypothetical protein HPP92_011938 [Vanilla planifolia]|uniref:Uncharacterized protein n=1 Tax=Vanilla planifolia TaxID=51239 RepID=A0A835R7F7_VANPL|nr:hypothetical protein HPP92_012285 [Vanilla planifolia]KAG0483854.1 hypothetical protein HPP92_011938 [Vanilla planifolia]